MKLSIVIPCYNEEATIEELVAQVQASPYDKEILIIDDGSQDRTREILAVLAEDPEIRVFLQPKSGKRLCSRRALWKRPAMW